MEADDLQSENDPNDSENSKRKKTNMSEFFEFEYTSERDKFAKCKLCFAKNNQEKIVKMKDANTTGITRHLRNHHPQEYS